VLNTSGVQAHANCGNDASFAAAREELGMRIAFITVAVVVAAAIGRVAAPSSGRASGEPTHLHGTPLRVLTGLRLVVADNPPFVLDVDAARRTPLRRVPTLRRGVSWVVGVGGQSAVVVAQSVWHHSDLFGVRGHAARVVVLGDGADVAPAADGRSVWIESVTRSGCTLRQRSLEGVKTRAPRAFACAATIASAGSLGLVVNRTRVIDPHTGQTLLRTRWGVLAATGRTLVLAGPGRTFTIVGATGRVLRRMPWPSSLVGLDAPAADPRGRYVALAFASPGEQALDVWLVDTKTMRLTQLPAMPTLVPLKRTSMAWTRDGRLVLLTRKGGRFAVALWRPGEESLTVKTLPLRDQRNGSSDSFAVLR
jgi:hypothetical protein